MSAVNEFFPDTTETPKGHMKQQRQGVRSTKRNNAKGDRVQDANTMSILTTAAPRNQSDVYFKVWDTQEKVYTDQTGKFPVQSSRGMRYIMIMVEIDGNYIDAEPMKNRTENEMIRAYLELLARVKESGVCDPKKHILDNEASAEFKRVIKRQSKLEIVPSDSHR